MRRRYRVLTRHELAKLEPNFNQRTDGGAGTAVAPPFTSCNFLEEKAHNERRHVECDLNRRKNREVCLQRAVGWRRRHISEKERKISHDPAKEHQSTLDAKASGSRFRANLRVVPSAI